MTFATPVKALFSASNHNSPHYSFEDKIGNPISPPHVALSDLSKTKQPTHPIITQKGKSAMQTMWWFSVPPMHTVAEAEKLYKSSSVFPPALLFLSL
ncbi:hypothetical protein SLA2020_326590 [Shorea laevis]